MTHDPDALAATAASVDLDGESVEDDAVESENLEGTRLDHFAVEGRLGRGGMGEVYAATDVSLDRSVAIKVLRAHVTAQSGMTERFSREARAQARFNHPNIVHIYYVGRRSTAGGHDSLFFAMERIDGGDLDDVLKRGETLPPEDARRAMIQVAQGLRAAQRAGVIHRDIKPSNLMMTTDGVIKIADFGLAKPVDGDSKITQEGAIVGSPYYMAPEQALGEEIDHRTDMYAMGASFYHLLAGRPPFEGPRPMVVVAKHLREELEPLTKVAPHVPPALARIVERLLAKKPDDRYPDYDALLAELDEAAPGQRAYAPFMTRAASVLLDFLVAGLLIGALGWVGLVIYLGVVTFGHAWRGQTPAKYLLGIEVRRDDGEPLGWPRALLRTVISLWMPILAGATIALTSGVPELLETIEGLRPAHLGDLQNLLVMTAISHGFMTLLYGGGLLLALFNAERKTVHDLAVGSVVVYKMRAPAAVSVQTGSGVRENAGLEKLGKKLSNRPPPSS